MVVDLVSLLYVVEGMILFEFYQVQCGCSVMFGVVLVDFNEVLIKVIDELMRLIDVIKYQVKMVIVGILCMDEVFLLVLFIIEFFDLGVDCDCILYVDL